MRCCTASRRVPRSRAPSRIQSGPAESRSAEPSTGPAPAASVTPTKHRHAGTAGCQCSEPQDLLRTKHGGRLPRLGGAAHERREAPESRQERTGVTTRHAALVGDDGLRFLVSAAGGNLGRRTRRGGRSCVKILVFLSGRRDLGRTKRCGIRPRLQTSRFRGLRPVCKQAPAKNRNPFIFLRIVGGVDGTRTRGLRRDRPAF
jgi:hypothetical protein